MADFDLAIIGGGPGGYVAAVRARQLGLKIALIEKERLGGICLNLGCIPSKALLHNAEVLSLFQRADEFGISFSDLRFDYRAAYRRSRQVADRLSKGVEFLMKKNGVSVFSGEALLTGASQIEIKPAGEKIKASNIILATGSRAANLPNLSFDGQRIINSDHAVLLEQIPKSMIIVGAGAIGMELGAVFQTYGCQVTVLEMIPQILPLEDPEIAGVLEKSLTKQGLSIHTQTKVETVEIKGDGVQVKATGPQGALSLSAEKVLIAIGRRGNTENLGLEDLGIAVERGFIKIDDMQRTNLPGMWAIGDVAGPPLLAHKASHEGIIAVEAIAGREPHPLDKKSIPSCTYTHPAVASIGITEAQAKEEGREIKVGRFPFVANGHALARAEHEGFIKVISDAKYGELLGAHMIGAGVTEIIHEFALGKKLESTPLEIGRTIHAHPTLSEALMEAALDAEGMVIHI
ncbi:MAG: dihydrolipoyl dehydrogenase [Chloroflexi bacterium]|nr:dihydrolipoyl dehydrogenase [Chloroflexota bacterium]